ncbi:MAG: type II/IV secretion system ATPase subunit [Nanoarchaeota archaeon]
MFNFTKNKEVQQQEFKPLFYINPRPQVADIPEIKEKEKIDVKYVLIEPYVYAHIFWDKENNELIYNIEEPILDEKEAGILNLLENSINELINISFIGMKSTDVVIEYLEKNLRVLLSEFKINITKESFLKLMYYIYRDFVGLNEFEPLLRDYYIEDIECNGVNSPVYIVHRKYRNVRTNVIFRDIRKLTSFVEKIAQKCGKYISYASPLLDASLPDGSRVNATYTQDISTKGPAITIRKFTSEPWSPVKLMQFKTVSPEMLAYLWLAIEHESNIMVIGGTGSGKTSLLNSIAFFIPPASRVVTIEDTRELNILHENWLPGVTRSGVGASNLLGTKEGEISLFDLLRESFRQRPDYIIVGEIRGKEAYVLFQGMSSGHPSFGTMHAEDVETMVRRLETPPIELSASLIESLDIVCIIGPAKVNNKEVRRVKKVVEIVRVRGGTEGVETNSPFVWDPRNDNFYFKEESKVFDKIVIHKGISKEKLFREFVLRTKLLVALYKNNIMEFKEVNDLINAYYKTPEAVLKKFNIS